MQYVLLVLHERLNKIFKGNIQDNGGCDDTEKIDLMLAD
jgi:hypothetical protein